MPDNNTLAAALDLVGHGVPVYPLIYGTKAPPAGHHGYAVSNKKSDGGKAIAGIG